MKRYIIIILDVIIAVYLVFAVTAFNNPEPMVKKCVKVNINVSDENTSGFLDVNEIKNILRNKGLYPLGRSLEEISPRVIESVLSSSPFVNTAECNLTIDGMVQINVTQRSPLVRVKGDDGSDYYIDENGGIMPQSKYISDLIIVTGSVTKPFAQQYLLPMVQTIMNDEFWCNQIVQINVSDNQGIEIVPRVGEHIVFLGYLPSEDDTAKRETEIDNFTKKKLDRLKKFYRYGLSVVGWNKYQRIDVQFDNQIICKKHEPKPHPIFQPQPVQENNEQNTEGTND